MRKFVAAACLFVLSVVFVGCNSAADNSKGSGKAPAKAAAPHTTAAK